MFVVKASTALQSAAYLVERYEELEGRVFEKRNIRQWGKRWYEYHRPRNREVMLARPKILTPRLTREVRFALDTKGVVPQDSCICLVPTDNTKRGWQTLRKQLAQALGRRYVQDSSVLKYCLAFLNSAYAQERLVTGRRPTPMGSYAVTERYLREIPIPPPLGKKTVATIMDLVDKVVAATDLQETARLETSLAKTVDGILEKHL